MKNKIKNLVLSGGKFRGIMYCSVIKLFEEENILDDIKQICAVSIGCIGALFIIIKYTSEELYNILTRIQYNSYFNITEESILNFFDTYGLEDLYFYIKFIKLLLKYKGYDENITLLELYNKTKINFIICTINLSLCEYEYFNYETHPNIPVWKIIRMSCTIPILITSIKYKKNYYVDGALTDNLPIHYFKNKEETLGIVIGNQWKPSPINNFFEYIYNIFYNLAYKNSLKNYNSDEFNILSLSEIQLEQDKLLNDKKYVTEILKQSYNLLKKNYNKLIFI
tara:strand:- start:1063 stop:1905 length:843 start_codon:yes stop_codon:yes gene_type:complete